MEIEKIDLHVIQNQGRWRELVSRPRAVGVRVLGCRDGSIGIKLLYCTEYGVHTY